MFLAITITLILVSKVGIQLCDEHLLVLFIILFLTLFLYLFYDFLSFIASDQQYRDLYTLEMVDAVANEANAVVCQQETSWDLMANVWPHNLILMSTTLENLFLNNKNLCLDSATQTAVQELLDQAMYNISAIDDYVYEDLLAFDFYQNCDETEETEENIGLLEQQSDTFIADAGTWVKKKTKK